MSQKRLYILVLSCVASVMAYAGPSNIAPQAKVTASSYYCDGLPENVVDGKSRIMDRFEWVSGAEMPYWQQMQFPWIRLDWAEEKCISKVILYDRPTAAAHTPGGVLTFSDGSRVSAGRTLGNVGTGTMLGVLLGGLVDGRGGAIVGAGIGATVGVGATLHDAGDSYTSWAMEAAVGTAARRIPDKDSLHTVAVTSRGNPRSKEEAFAGLEDALCRAILESVLISK